MQAIISTIQRGAPLYNSGDIASCSALYESLADSFQIDSQLPALHTALLKDAIQSTSPSVDARAWLFRRIFDRTLADLQFTPHSEAPLPAGFPPPGKVGVVTRKAYPAYRCATDPGGQFGALFGHISSHGVAMTAPVISSLEQPTMSFVYASTALGKPGSGGGRVVVQDLPPLMVLSVGIRGDMGHSNVTLARRVLEEALSSGKFGVAAPGGDWRTLGYNSPMVPNERRFWELQVPLKGE